MIETRQGTLWSFPAGWLMHERDVKGYAVELVDHELEVVELKVGIAEVRPFFPPYTDA
jgi:hypothetical protein